jgi:hypothetical protein
MVFEIVNVFGCVVVFCVFFKSFYDFESRLELIPPHVLVAVAMVASKGLTCA